ncbi:MAG TPA: phosphoenolpyruvate carboxykinase (ATP) [Flavobacteriales bacterium]|nr:phosphoenolpyruvate carboxykinase (ATP) [Flavobacteriales bacterium]
MTHKGRRGGNASIENLGITDATIFWNLTSDELGKISIEKNLAVETSTGAITIDTGEFTGRSPKDRFIVKDDITKDLVWWGDINIPFDPEKFDQLFDKMTKYLSGKELFVRDAYACADPDYRMNIRVVNELPWGNLFVHNMFLRPTEEELENFKPEWTVINATGFFADPAVDGTRQHNFAILNFTKKMAIIGGTGYTGETKKGVFSALNFILPTQKKVLSMHCSANIGEGGDTALFFGLSGTGKTTLSADPNRKLIGDDEHGWSDKTVFNFEGGCYAKCINLSQEAEPEIWNAIRPGAVLENVVLNDGHPDYDDNSLTENTRVAYPLDYIPGAVIPSVGGHPKVIVFLTADAMGVLPPVSRLTKEGAMYHFMSGYTSKLAGTERGIKEPKSVFSECFGTPFMPRPASVYAKLLGEKINQHNTTVYLINTGWSGGPYGIGTRIKIKYSRAMVTAALTGELDKVEYRHDELFNLDIPTKVDDVPPEILDPKNTWSDKDLYEKSAKNLAKMFVDNFEKFKGVSSEIKNAGPKLL